MGYQVEERETKELFTYKVLESFIVTFKYVLAYSWEEGVKELEQQGYELVD